MADLTRHMPIRKPRIMNNHEKDKLQNPEWHNPIADILSWDDMQEICTYCSPNIKGNDYIYVHQRDIFVKKEKISDISLK